VATFAPVFDSLLPEAVDRSLGRILGSTMPREGGRYRIVLAGRFDGQVAADLLAFAHNHAKDSALVLGDTDCVRVLYFHGGLVVGADSDVIFERVARTLRRRGAVTAEEAEAVLELETSAGLVVASGLLRRETLEFGLEQRAWEIGRALPFLHGAHFFLVGGTPNLGGLPLLGIAPMDLALEGVRRYDEWRHARARAPRVTGARPKDTAGLPDLPPRRAPATAALPASC
jgi:hypothetical protein